MGNEAKRWSFIHTFMLNVAELFCNEGVKLRREHPIFGDIVGEPVEFVLVQGKAIFNIVEAKKDDWEQGRAQLLMQLDTAHTNNVNMKLSPNHVICGAVSNANDWELYSYNGKSWTYYGRFCPFPRNMAGSLSEYENACKQLLRIIEAFIKMSIKSMSKEM